MNRFLLFSCTLACFGFQALSQPVDSLHKYYSGQVTWDQDCGLVHFQTSGLVQFPNRENYMAYKWEVPEGVKEIVIDRGVRVNGFFHCFNNILIKGQSRDSSIIFGTQEQNLLRREGLDKIHRGSVPYSAIYCEGEIEVRVQNLTVLNPFGFMFTGKEGAVMHLWKLNGLDTRGGLHNHSDGISAWHGSTVRECYFEAGDDVIKVYHDIYVENTTINMITNSVPIQLGWGNYGSGATGVFRNLTIIGDQGRPGTGNAIIDARYGEYNKVLLFDGLVIDNPNASLFDFWNEPKNGRSGGNAIVRIVDANIRIGQFQQRWNMDAEVEICGQKLDEHTEEIRFICEEEEEEE